MRTCLGLELGSTRIKAVTIDGGFRPVSSGDYTWASAYENGIWTYSLDEVWTGLRAALSQVEDRQDIAAAGRVRHDARLSGLRQGLEPAGAFPHMAEHHHRACGSQAHRSVWLQYPPAVEHRPPVPSNFE